MRFPHVATIRRMIENGTLYEYDDVDTVRCFLQPMGTEESQALGLTFTQSFVCYVPLTTDIEESDRLVVSSQTFGVKGIREHNYGGLAHKRLSLEQVK